MTTIQSPPCPHCGASKTFEVTELQAKQLALPRGTRPLIQNILPEIHIDDRERFISGFCPPCWDSVMGEPDD